MPCSLNIARQTKLAYFAMPKLMSVSLLIDWSLIVLELQAFD